MSNALIGHTGYVGSSLLRQAEFTSRYRSTDIGGIDGKSFDTVVCAAAPAQKWIANREPQADRAGIEALMGHLATIRCRSFVLVSTVDVFRNPVQVDEGSAVDEDGLHAYGLHRRMLEKFVESRFERRLVVRLPGLVGPGLRKNVVFDLLNDNNLAAIESRSVFQFYPMVNLWYDIGTALGLGLDLVHLTAAPVSVARVAQEGFGRAFDNTLPGSPASYDFQSRHAAAFGVQGRYQYGARDTIQAIRAYAQSEPRAGLHGGKR